MPKSKVKFVRIQLIRPYSIEFNPKLNRIQPNSTIFWPKWSNTYKIYSDCTLQGLFGSKKAVFGTKKTFLVTLEVNFDQSQFYLSKSNQIRSPNLNLKIKFDLEFKFRIWHILSNSEISGRIRTSSELNMNLYISLDKIDTTPVLFLENHFKYRTGQFQVFFC